LIFVRAAAIVPSSIDGARFVARQRPQSELLPGTLDLLILRVLREDTLHGYAVAQRLREISKDVLQVGESSLYPALQRLLLDGYVRAEWGASENNRRARFYTLTAAGRKQLVAEQDEFERMVGAIQAVLRLA
jgi:PadR family transcriptional regulator PadR